MVSDGGKNQRRLDATERGAAEERGVASQLWPSHDAAPTLRFLFDIIIDGFVGVNPFDHLDRIVILAFDVIMIVEKLGRAEAAATVHRDGMSVGILHVQVDCFTTTIVLTNQTNDVLTYRDTQERRSGQQSERGTASNNAGQA